MILPKILIIDDDYTDIFLVKESIREMGFNCEVTEAMDGEIGLEKLKNEKFDLVLLDINMPKINGLKLLDIIRKDSTHNGVIIIIVTTSNHEKEIEEAKLKGADGYIIKNINGYFLSEMETIRNIIFNKRFTFITYPRNI